MTRLEKAQVGLIVSGIILVVLGANWDRAWMVDLGLLLGGAGVLSSGIDILVSKRVGFWSRISQDLNGSGPRAVLSGVLLTTIGIWTWTLASVRLLGIAPQAGTFLAHHPGITLLNAALLLFLLGAFGLFRLEGWRASFQNVLQALPILLISGILLLAGFTALLIGLYALLDPGALKSLISSWLSLLILPP